MSVVEGEFDPLEIESILEKMKIRAATFKRSDDFGHDCDAEYTYWVEDAIPKLISSLEFALYYVEGDEAWEILCAALGRYCAQKLLKL